MAPRGRPPLPRAVRSFEQAGWGPGDPILLDTTVVVDALLSAEADHAACVALFEALATSEPLVIYNELLETELCETLFKLALKERHGSKWAKARYDGRVRRRAGRLLDSGMESWRELLETLKWARVHVSEVNHRVPSLMRTYGLGSYDAVHAATLLEFGIGNIATLDRGFTAIPQSRLTIHTADSMLSTMRLLRSRA